MNFPRKITDSQWSTNSALINISLNSFIGSIEDVSGR